MAWRVALAALFVACAAALRVWPLGDLGTTVPWVTFYPAMVVAAMAGGGTAGLVATALSCLTVTLLWPLLSSSPFLHSRTDYLRMGIFALIGILFSTAVQIFLGTRKFATRTARTLEERERFLREIADSMPGMVGYWDRDLCCRFANQAYREWFGKRPDEVVGHSMEHLMGKELLALNAPYVRAALAGERQSFERTLTKADGSLGFTLANYIPDRKSDGRVAGFFVQVTDVTPLKAAEDQLVLAASVFHNTVEGILITDADQVILSVNPAFTQITGYSPEEAIGRTPRILKSDHHDQPFYESMWMSLLGSGRWQGEIWNRRKDGEAYLEWLTITRIEGSKSQPVRYVSVFHDITEIRQNDERIRHLAFHDALTDLPNRALLMNRLEQQLARAERDRSQLAILFLDLDRFKAVNDTLGHEIGDELLKQVALRLLGQVRHADTVARLGGDEFVVLLDAPSSREEVATIAERILAAINEPMSLHGKSAQVGTSIGIAMFPGDGRSPEDLIRSADIAMFVAKEEGKNSYRFHPGSGSRDLDG